MYGPDDPKDMKRLLLIRLEGPFLTFFFFMVACFLDIFEKVLFSAVQGWRG